MQNTDVPNNGLAYPVDPAVYRNLLSVRGYTHERPDEYNVQYGVSVSRELPGAVNLTVGYTGSRARTCSCAASPTRSTTSTRVRPVPTVGQVDYKTSGCLDGLVINGNPISGCGEASYDALQIGVTRRFRAGLTGSLQYQYSRNEGTTQGSNEAATASNTFDYNTEFGRNLERHPAHVQRLADLHAAGRAVSGRAAGASAASSTRAAACPINVIISRPDTVSVDGVDGDQHPGRQLARHAAAGPGAGRRSVPEGRRPLAQPGRVRGADAGHVRQSAAQLPARAGLLAGGPDGRARISGSRRTRASSSASRSSTSPTG